MPVTDPSEDDGYFYRAVRHKIENNVIKPTPTEMEAVSPEGDLAYRTIGQDIVYPSQVMEATSFSQTIGGAVIGAMTGQTGISGGKFYIYRTDETDPEIDLRDEVVDDFPVIQEARFKRPVEVEYVGSYEVDSGLEKDIGRCYAHEITEEERDKFVEESVEGGTPREMARQMAESGPDITRGVWVQELKELRNMISRKVKRRPPDPKDLLPPPPHELFRRAKDAKKRKDITDFKGWIETESKRLIDKYCEELNIPEPIFRFGDNEGAVGAYSNERNKATGEVRHVITVDVDQAEQWLKSAKDIEGFKQFMRLFVLHEVHHYYLYRTKGEKYLKENPIKTEIEANEWGGREIGMPEEVIEKLNGIMTQTYRSTTSP